MDDMTRRLYGRQNYYIGKFLHLRVYINKVNCIILTRRDLHEFLDVDRLDGTRLRWFREDLKKRFPYQECCWETGSSSSMSLLYLSRVPINYGEAMLYFKMPEGDRIYNENQILKELAKYNFL